MTELIICILPIFIIKPVQVSFRKKMTVVVAFAFRIFVIIATIIRLAFMQKSPSSADMTTYAFQTTVITQCVLCVSLMTACIPCLKPFLDAFETGMLNVTLHKRIGGGSNSNSYGNSYALAGMSRGKRESVITSQYVEDEIEMLGSSAAAFAVTYPEDLPVDRSPTMAIQRTDQWSVRHEYVDTKALEDTGSETSANRVGQAI
ncbi:hypothetical protein N7448_008689 [Penicillium atrosanguineum]|uniref:Rhodopsin domain-containing protein n=1 Tax=Penicillium atrosanguineum TaxID=1132637 RepID=A0A9W9GRX3_9EURO|nr:L-Aspartase-like protein [Penicillium atrosanguineum]KAJ5127910.1 hypothetical protein N7448_008689 [Penicillium atrosanguineum]KAJ5148119.1 hypothetical protein N7526_001471 [Penicillium atrosanguineum]KAJ5313402.1 L-Aspartase-like protein [Penicillium atrosanguineum]KAJ5330587.1 hypothetical protein N7476_000370 [Penicillium atrosanguineum]